jgi:hypothetical protein
MELTWLAGHIGSAVRMPRARCLGEATV